MLKYVTKDLHPDYRPDEKFINYGPEALSDAELLAIVLRTGSTDLNSVDLARKILTPNGDNNTSILNIYDYNIHELKKIKGIGNVKAIQIMAIAELSKRISRSQASKKLVFNDPNTIADYYMEQLRHEKNEKVVVLLLDSACHLIKEQLLSSGTVNASIISSRDVFICALKNEAVSFILLHNHPSGNPCPSGADIHFTEEIENAGELIGIRLIDHIIIGDNCYFSFKEKELIHE